MRCANGRFRTAALAACAASALAWHNRAAFDVSRVAGGNVLGKVPGFVWNAVFRRKRGVVGGSLSGGWPPLSGPTDKRTNESIT